MKTLFIGLCLFVIIQASQIAINDVVNVKNPSPLAGITTATYNGSMVTWFYDKNGIFFLINFSCNSFF